MADVNHTNGTNGDGVPVKTEQEHVSRMDAITQPKDMNADLSARWLASYTGERFEITDADNNEVRNRIDMFLIPVIFYVYWTQQLDKSSLSFSSVFGIQTDAHLVGQDYSWLSSIVYFAQIVFQILSVYALVKFPVNIWLCACFFTWGSVLMISAAFTDFAGLAAFRFLLGAAEASIAPTMLVVVAMFWTRREAPLRNNIWYSANGMATILGSLLSYGLGHANSKLYPYQLIFLVCGAIAVALVLPTYFLFPGHPTTAWWLTDRQKYIALERIRLNNTGTQSRTFKWSQVAECFIDPKTWMFFVIIFCISLVSGGIGAFGPLILKGFGLTSFQTILYNMIPGAIGIVSRTSSFSSWEQKTNPADILSAIAVIKFKYKAPVIFVASCFPVAAAAALYALPRGVSHQRSLLAVFFILQVFQCITALVFTWIFANTAGHTKKTTTIGIIYVALGTGNIVGPQLYRSDQAPYYQTGLIANLVVLCIMISTIVLLAAYLSFLNSQNVKRRRAAGRTGAHVDFSLESSANWARLRAAQAEKNAAEGHQEVYNAEAFDDLTDKQNIDFVYSL